MSDTPLDIAVDRIVELEAKLAATEKEHSDITIATRNLYAKSLADLKAKLTAAEKDAERYRYLRNNWFVLGEAFPWDGLDEATTLRLDYAIDAAKGE